MKWANMIVKQVDFERTWTEKIAVGEYETSEETANRIINHFNNTLRPQETAREFVRIEHSWIEEEEIENEIINNKELDKMTLTNEQVDEVVDNLRGTCTNTIDSVVEDLFEIESSELTTEDYVAIEEHIFQCIECGWWYETSEKDEHAEEPVCKDCKGDIESDADRYDGDDEYDDIEEDKDDEEWCYDCDNSQDECEC